MTINDLIQSSLQSLARTKARSVLTMLGIVIGVMSVILMLSVGEAAQRYILAQISSFGSDTMFIANGPETDQGQPSLFVKESLTMKDVKKLQSVAWISMIAAKLQQDDQVTAGGFTTNAQVVGTMPDEIRLNDIQPRLGVFFQSSAVDANAKEAVLGNDIATTAFGAEDPIGKSIKISNTNFRVVGVMAKSGTKGFQNVDTQVYVPVTTAMEVYNKKYVSMISLRPTVPLADAKNRIQILLRERHGIDNPTGELAKDDFHLMTQEDLIRSADTITNILQILLVSIAAISLIVGGIGIMNIMYVSVTERTHEIGLRKAVGAQSRDVLRQFLVEAVVQTMIGGVIGTALGVGFSWLGIQIISSFQSGWEFSMSWNGVLLGISVSALIGVTFGYFPARRAAFLHPIDALRFE
ncbi:ABC transporter permease [Patescibacteria group bacterium]|nr:ABC transporter permease [Patescibacteria group bacterium]